LTESEFEGTTEAGEDKCEDDDGITTVGDPTGAVTALRGVLEGR